MSNTSARPLLPSLQSLAFPSSDRIRANAGSSHDAGNVEFSKLLQKALGAPDATRDIEDMPLEREPIGIETLSIAQGFNALDRPLAGDSFSADAVNTRPGPGDGSPMGDDANRSCGAGSDQHQGDGASPSAPISPMTSSAAPTSPAPSAAQGGSAPSVPSDRGPGETVPNTVPGAALAPTATPMTPVVPAATPAQPLANGSNAPVGQNNDAQVPTPAFADLLVATAPETSTAPASVPPASAAATPIAPTVPTPATTIDISAAASKVDGAKPATPVPTATTPNAASSGIDMSAIATAENAADNTSAATANAVQNPTLAASIAAAAPAIPSPGASKSVAAPNRVVTTDALDAAATTSEVTLATTVGPRATLAPEATEPTLRGTAHPPAALTAQLAQDASSAPAATPPAPSTPSLQPIPIPTTAGLTDETLDVPIINAEGVDASTAGAEPTGREAAMVANASPISNEQTVARAQRAAMHPAVAQVAVSVTKAVQEGVDRITIKLQPPELGRIDVRIDVGVDGRIQAVFAAERPATMEILQRDVRELERALQNAGLSTDAGSLSFGLKQQGGGRYTPFAGGMSGDAPANELPVTGDILVARNAAARRADGHLDIHV